MSLFISSTVCFCLLKKKSIMPGVCLFNYFFKTNSFSLGWSDDQPLTLDTSTRVICRELGSTLKTHPCLANPHPGSEPRVTSPAPLSTLNPSAVPSSNVRFLQLISCSVLLRTLFFLSPPSQITHLVKVFKFQLRLSSFALLLCLVCSLIFLSPLLDPEILEGRGNLFFLLITGTCSLFLLPQVTPFSNKRHKRDRQGYTTSFSSTLRGRCPTTPTEILTKSSSVFLLCQRALTLACLSAHL